MARLPIIDADGHIVERQSEIKEYLEAPWDKRTSPALFQGDHPWDSKLFGTHEFQGYPENGTAAEQVEAWLRWLDQEGIETAVLFPTVSGTINRIQEPDYAIALARACNNHFAQDYGARSPRLRPVGVLPLRDPQAAAAELRRAVTELGLISFELLTVGLPLALGDPYYHPIYAEAERLGVPLCIHGSRSYSWEVGGDKLKTFADVHCYAFTATVLLHFTSIFSNGVPALFPKLRLAFLEIGATWLPYYLDRLDEHWEKRGKHEMPNLPRKPSEIFRESDICVTLEAEEGLLPQTIDYLGDSHFMYATDMPHWDSEFPENLHELIERPDLSEETKRKLLYDNAKRFYGL